MIELEVVLDDDHLDVALSRNEINVEVVGAGPQGPKGTSGDLNYIQNFSSTDTVVVAHNFDKYPAVTVIDSAGDEVEGSVAHDSLNQLTITFSAPFSGKVICN